MCWFRKLNLEKTYWKFIKGECGKPRRKHKSETASIYLTRECFRFEQCPDGNQRLFIGTKTNNIGYLSIKMHRTFSLPNSITIKRERGRYYVSFCFGEKGVTNLAFNKDNLTHLRNSSSDWLAQHTVGIDRGVAIPVQTQTQSYDFTAGQKRNKTRHERYVKRLQRRLSKQQKGSRHRARTKQRLSHRHEHIANIRNDFCHQVSHRISADKDNKIIVLEDLNTQGMSCSAKGDRLSPGKQVKAKSGLNKAILDKGWHRLEVYLAYKTQRQGKAFFKVSAHHTSQTCADCWHTHPANRQTQSQFVCQRCGHTDHADKNAAKVIALKAIRLIQDSGTELSNRGVLMPQIDKGRGAKDKTHAVFTACALGGESSKKKGTIAAFEEVA